MSGLTIYKGQTWKRRLTVTNAATGAPYDLTGATISFRGKHRTADPGVLVDLAIGTGVTLLTQSGATLGQADVQIDGADSAELLVDSLICAAVVIIPGETDAKVVVPPIRIDVRDLP